MLFGRDPPDCQSVSLIIPLLTTNNDERAKMKHFCWTLAIACLGLLAPSLAWSIPTCGCYCPDSALIHQTETTWGAAPAYTCDQLKSINESAAQQAANNQCSSTYLCTFSIDPGSCINPGCSNQGYGQDFYFKCAICLDPC
jgi:hypothetical protein